MTKKWNSSRIHSKTNSI